MAVDPTALVKPLVREVETARQELDRLRAAVENGTTPAPPHNSLADTPTADIADATGVSRWHIRRVKAGQSVPSYGIARRIADFLSISVDELYAMQPETELVRRVKEGRGTRAGQPAHRRQRSPHNGSVGAKVRTAIRRDYLAMSEKLGHPPTLRQLARKHKVSPQTVSNVLAAAERVDTGA